MAAQNPSKMINSITRSRSRLRAGYSALLGDGKRISSPAQVAGETVLLLGGLSGVHRRVGELGAAALAHLGELRRAVAEARVAADLGELGPVVARAVERVAVDRPADARDAARRGVLPHGPAAVVVAVLGLRRRRAHPVR